IVTKGSSEQYDYYVTSYRVSSSRDGKNWRPYRGSGGQEDKVFEGNADSHGEVSNAFIPPIVARYIRVTPQSWHQRMALKVALVGCQPARARVPRPYVPSIPREVPVPTSRPASRTPIPGIALDPEKAGSALLVMLLIGGSVLLCSSLLLLAFLCRRK
ncbi:PREDICTED: discoidin, CUB and LCCL domain-containing protein 2-like, partial [Phaethon lepturus]|uniref:discoidin, CUB and LCCL domain-containing protein 2-like n=1 Tax=Phaethon lepturus TaxID=97097 RepID=UPI0005304E2C